MKLSALILSKPPTPPHKDFQNKPSAIALWVNSEWFFLLQSEQQSFGIFLYPSLVKKKKKLF